MNDNESNAHPDMIGPYRIIRPLGEGGMAMVYLAEQNEPVARQVALKILKPGMDSEQIVARFESERQALAVLDHPNIAKIFDGGIAGNGRPYFVMEYIDGTPITDFCDENRLNTTKRLRLFTDVCRAVQHAHLKGLIHRDLKPTNILVGDVDGTPQARVIDFGIAKATEAIPGDTAPETRIGQIVGTPQYMSPEQTGIDGTDIDSRTDVYSLGVVLYELLVGELPLDLSAVRDIALPSVIREKVPPRPSARYTSLGAARDDVAIARATTAQDLGRTLKGDLDWIVMKAIDKDRERRYETANALALECERFLNKEPVVARPPSAGYLLGRFVQRNRVVVAAGSIALLAIIGGAVAATIGFLRATEAEQVARQEAETATQISEFLAGLFQTSDPAEAQGENISAREALDRGIASIDEELVDQPIVRAALKTTMGGVYRELGLIEQAETLLNSALETRTQLLGPDHPDTLTTANWLGIVIMEQGRLEDAESTRYDTLERRRRVLGDRHIDTLKSMQNLAVLYRFTSRFAEAEPLFLEALAAMRETLGSDDTLTLLTMANLGAMYREMARFDEAISLLEEAAETHGRVFGAEHPRTFVAMNNLADLYLDMQRYDEAEALYITVLDGRRRVLGEDNAQTVWSMDRVAGLYAAQERFSEAEPLQAAATEGLLRVYGPEHPDALAGRNNLAEIYRILGRFDEAEPIYTDVLSTQQRLRPDDIGTGITNHNLAAMYTSAGRYDEALPLFAEAERIWLLSLPPDHYYLIENYRVWTEARRGGGDEAGAKELEDRIEELGK